ncbi:GTP cyclohydrolase FolE2 [Marinomonas ostreistagni]|uniref:GTP cyclohydrolase FolE2 n=1 Tax=Marinomonas ostreistagni TaxID=359209 RepID=UPI00194F7FEB|nr:GTP cyclohydrolase FolE2 [Marinomonas ostreistagni]MBM6550077.1 GTP cyclohydrolase I FolE2 [Marinomonas ostreistagni]
MNASLELPDVASALADDLAIDQVGMAKISLPLQLEIDRQIVQAPATARITANVQNAQKGLHMSRMYQSLKALSQNILNTQALTDCAHSALKQQQEVCSTELNIELEFELLRQRSALHSQQFGWNRYPIKLTAHYQKDSSVALELQFTVTYSSSCPASAALSRSALKDAFLQAFGEVQEPIDTASVADWLNSYGTLAIPHSQRSEATINVKLAQDASLPIETLIDLAEDALGTPVQTFVKRQDEQQFAINNGQNPMFVEDATRRLMLALTQSGYQGYLRVAHYESLHGHDAIAESQFGHRLTNV